MGLRRTKVNIRLAQSDQSRTQIANINRGLKQKLNRAFASVFGKDAKIEDYYGKDKGKKIKALYKKGQAPSKYAARLRDLYEKAWLSKYDSLRSEMSSAGMPSRDQRTKKKRWADNKYKPHTHRRGVKYVGAGLMTGFLRQSIAEGFRTGGNKYIDIPNVLLLGAYKVNMDMYPKRTDGDWTDKVTYPVRLIEKLIKRGVVESYEDFFNFEQSGWDKIAAFSQNIIDTDFVEEFRKEFETVKRL